MRRHDKALYPPMHIIIMKKKRLMKNIKEFDDKILLKGSISAYKDCKEVYPNIPNFKKKNALLTEIIFAEETGDIIFIRNKYIHINNFRIKLNKNISDNKLQRCAIEQRRNIIKIAYKLKRRDT